MREIQNSNTSAPEGFMVHKLITISYYQLNDSFVEPGSLRPFGRLYPSGDFVLRGFWSLRLQDMYNSQKMLQFHPPMSFKRPFRC